MIIQHQNLLTLTVLYHCQHSIISIEGIYGKSNYWSDLCNKKFQNYFNSFNKCIGRVRWEKKGLLMLTYFIQYKAIFYYYVVLEWLVIGRLSEVFSFKYQGQWLFSLEKNDAYYSYISR